MRTAAPGEYEALVAAIGSATRLRRESDHYKGRCPLHDDSTPSLCVYPRNRAGEPDPHYWCFGCGAHGDLIDWLRRREGLDFRAARARVGVLGTHGWQQANSTPAREPAPPGEAWQGRAERLLAWSQGELWGAGGAAARAWLTGPKRLLTEETIRAAGIGWVPRAIWDAAAAWGLPGGKPLLIPRGLLIPTRVWGKVWGIKTRALEAGRGPKYGAIKGSVPAVLGCDEVAPGDVVIGLEGEFDRWLCWQEMGLEPAAFRGVKVCTKGAATHRLDRFWLWKLSPAARLVWVLDNDEAGRRAAAAYEAMGIGRMSCVFPPAGFKDPTEMAGGGRRVLGEWLRGLAAGS